jgi:hypothetical protein
LRGTVSLVGNEPGTELVLEPSGAPAEIVALRTTDTLEMRRVIGLEVVVFGRPTAERSHRASPRGAPVFDVTSFIVRAADGEPATDGILDIENGTFFVKRVDGSRAVLERVPSPLRGELGARVFLIGPLSRMPTAFGVIREAQ